MSAYSDMILAEAGLVSYWRMGDASGNVTDQKGHSPGTTVSGITRGTGSLIQGDSDPSMAANNVPSAQIKCPYTASMNTPSSQLTVEAWVMPQAIVPNGFAIERTGLGSCWWLTLSGDTTGTWYAQVWDTGGAKHVIQCDPSSVAVAYKTQHLVMTYDSSAGRFRFYVNGKDVTTPVSGQSSTPGGNVATGSSPIYMFGSGVVAFNGFIDEVAFYSTALTAAQVTNHYNAGATIPAQPPSADVTAANATADAPPPTPVTTFTGAYQNLILGDTAKAYWRLGEASGTVLDTTGNGTTAPAGNVGAGVTRNVPGLIRNDPDGAVASNGVGGSSITIPETAYIGAQSFNTASFECWVKPTALPPSGKTRGVAGQGNVWEIQLLNSGVFWAHVRDANSVDHPVTASAMNPVVLGSIHHLVLTWDAITARQVTLYVDGVAYVASLAFTAGSLSDVSPVYLCTGGLADLPFQGTLDEAAFYWTALTPSQVLTHYQKGGPAIDLLAPNAITIGAVTAPTDSVDSFVPAA